MKVAYLGTKLPINLEADLALLREEQVDVIVVPMNDEISTNYVKSFGDFDCVVTGNTIAALRLCAHFKIGTYRGEQLHLFDLRPLKD